jgi:hypothetical protein
MDKLTKDELRVIRDALGLVIDKITNYPHQEYSHKLNSLKPVEALRDKVRQLIKDTK